MLLTIADIPAVRSKVVNEIRSEQMNNLWSSIFDGYFFQNFKLFEELSKAHSFRLPRNANNSTFFGLTLRLLKSHLQLR